MRVVGYYRVSSAEQVEGYSLDAQRLAVRRRTAELGHELVAEFADEGRSARSDRLETRPGFTAAIAEVKSGHAEAVMVHKSDRAARNLLVLLQVLHDLGGGILAVEGDFDYTTPDGKLRAHILGSVAQWYSDNLSQEVKKGKNERRRQGLYNGPLPFGVKRHPDDESGRMPPVPDDGPVLCTVADRREWSPYQALQHMFALAAAGMTSKRIVQEMRTMGFAFGLTTVWTILHNRFYIGELSITDPRTHRKVAWVPGAHQTFIEPALFADAVETRAANRRGSKALREKARVYPLTGLCRCARCRAPMHSRANPRNGAPSIYCYSRSEHLTCDQSSMLVEPLEQQALKYVELFTPPVDVAAWIAQHVTTDQRDTRRERASIEKRLQKLRDLYLWGDLEQETYLMQRRDLEEQLQRCRPQELGESAMDQLMHLLTNLGDAYTSATWEERNELLKVIFTVLEVDAGHVTRVQLAPAFDRLLALWHTDVVAQSRFSDNVCIAVPDRDGYWIVPPLDILRRTTPRIPTEYWPRVYRDYLAGARAEDLANQWRTSPRTIWRVIRHAREGQAAVDRHSLATTSENTQARREQP